MKLNLLHASRIPASRQNFARRLAALLATLIAVTPCNAATVRTWTGGSATSGNWTTAANWSSGVPVAGDILNFVGTGARKSSNTNNFAAGTTFSVINVFGTGYRLRGNRVTITNQVAVGNPAGTHAIDLDITLGGPASFVSLVSFNASAQLTLNGDINLGSRTLYTEGPADFIIGGVISGSGGIFKRNTGDLSLSGLGANTFTGTTTVGGGILRLGRYNIGPGLTIVGTTAIAGDLIIGDFVSTLIGRIAVLDRDSQIANTSTVTVRPTGSLELSDENDTIGELRLHGGTVTTGNGVLSVDGGIYAIQPAIVNKDSVIVGRLNLGGRGDGPQLIDVAQGVQLNIPAQISGVTTAHLIKTNRGELFLSASNTFHGDVEIVGGTLTITHGNALGTTNGVTKIDLGTLALSGTFVIPETLVIPGPFGTLDLVNGSASVLGNVILDDDLTVVSATNSTLNIVGQISGPAGWVKYGPGTFQFKTTYTNTYAGTSWVREGNFIMDGVFNQPVIPGPFVIGDPADPPNSTRAWPIKHNQIADLAPVTIHQSGEMPMIGFHDTIGSLQGTGEIDLGSGTLTVGANNTSTSFSGVLNGAGSLVKIGSATLSLTGNNTCTGVTTNISGTLLIDGSLGNTVEVHSGAVLGGNGQVQAITGLAGGEVSPGSSPGRLQVQGNVALADSLYRVELNGLTPGTDYDQLRVSGNVDLGASTLLATVGFAPALGDNFVIIDKVSRGPVTGGFLNLPEGSTIGVGVHNYRITYQGGDGNDVALTHVEMSGFRFSSITPSATGQMQLLGQGVPFGIYILEAAPHLNSPIPWTPIATNTANALGVYEFIDVYADNGMNLHPARLYRVRSP